MKLIEEMFITEVPQGWKPYYIFGIYVEKTRVGSLILRTGSLEERYFDGHIGYTIEPLYRGHHYAYQACLLIKEIALQKGFEELIITCSPENIASQSTIEHLHATYLETLPVPAKLRQDFAPDETKKKIYKWTIKETL